MDVNSFERPDEPSRRSKTRSSQACQACRSRKVRCDVLTNGSCCTNCRLDLLDCVVTASRRGRNKFTRKEHVAEIVQSRTTQATAPTIFEADPNSARPKTRSTQEDVVTPSVSNAETGVIPVCVTFDEDLDNDETERQSVRENGDRQDEACADSEADDGLLTPRITVTSEPYQSPTAIASLPTFIAPLSTRVLNEDIQFLARKGAFNVPEPDLQVEILRGYMFSVHPFLPVLDFQDFFSAVGSDGDQGKVSLLLFQAVIFAGVHSLPQSVIYRLGFATTKHAREVLYSRARLLYDFEVETNNTAVFQSLLLLSSWYSKWRERRHTWHWTGLAYDIARSMGLHREPSTRHASDKVCRFRKRLWWSLYIRDRMIALGTRRPMRIRDDDFDVTMLTLNDFDIPSLEHRTSTMDFTILSAEEMTSTSLMCIQLAKLSICIGDVVSSQYTTLHTQPDVPRTMLVVSRRDGGAFEALEACAKELETWYRSLQEDVEWPQLSTPSDGLPSCSEVHWNVLLLTYLTTVNVLHRAQAINALPDHAETWRACELSRSKVKETARDMTRLSQTMLRKDQARYLSLIGVTTVIAACLSHILDINSSDEDVRDASTLRLFQSVQVLQYLQGIYASADAAASFVESLAAQAGITIPIQADSPCMELARVGTSSLGSSAARFHHSPHLYRRDTFSNATRPLSQASTTSAQLKSGSNIPHLGINWGPNNGLGQGSDTTDLLSATLPPLSSPAIGSRRRDMFGDPTASDADPFQIDTNSGGPWHSGGGPTSFNWNSNSENGMDFGLMSFNYDFYTHTFGFFEQ